MQSPASDRHPEAPPPDGEGQPSAAEQTQLLLDQVAAAYHEPINAQASHVRSAADLTITRAARPVYAAVRAGLPVPVAAGANMIEDVLDGVRHDMAFDATTRRRGQDAVETAKGWLMDYRGELLERFAAAPEDDEVWDDAVALVRAEADRPARWISGDRRHRPAVADDIPGEELIALAEEVRAAEPTDRYALMAQRAPNGKSWFDTLTTFSGAQIETAMAEVLDGLLSERSDGGSFGRALDLGTGTGKSLSKLEARSDEVVGVDRNSSLLALAEEAAASGTSLVESAVDDLPFPDASFDVATSSGLVGALDKATAERFYREIARVLAQDGIYMDGSYYSDQNGRMGEEMDSITATAKATLADMIVDTVSGKLQITDHLSDEETVALLAELNLEEELLLVPAHNSSYAPVSLVRLVRKR
ncbi:MAG TPA: class I SAM-dependent methyltransferase [Candidatus Saccharimonadales bacterium]|nr:class I SAM-dependent methyltransferase [Candidatus Saccharimonadales bacterium]